MGGSFWGDSGTGFEGRSFAEDWVLPHTSALRGISVTHIGALFTRSISAAGGQAQVEYSSMFQTLRWPERVPAPFSRVWNRLGKINKALQKTTAAQLVHEQGLLLTSQALFLHLKCSQSPKGSAEQGRERRSLGKGFADQKRFVPVY